MRLSVLAVLCLPTFGASAASPEVPPGTPLMPPLKVRLIVDAERYTDIDFPARPAVVRDVVNLIPGETIFVEAEIKGTALVNLKLVKKAVRPERTLTLEFSQTEDREAPMMMLVVKNPFKKAVTYRAEIQRLGEQRFEKTSTVPVQAGLQTFESWPYPITRILLKDFALGVPKSRD
jgi:hypothetical protein